MADTKARYWVAVMYPENMIDDWQDVIAEKLQRPFAYCIHNKCVDSEGNHRKDHVHIMLVYGAPTTYKNAMSVFKVLEKPGCVALNKCERVIGVRYMYNYLIHDTEESRKKKKHRYPSSERIEGNGFDIGCYEQISMHDKATIKKSIRAVIAEQNIFNFYDLDEYVASQMSDEAYDVFTSNQGYFANLVRGYYNKVRLYATGENTFLQRAVKETTKLESMDIDDIPED